MLLLAVGLIALCLIAAPQPANVGWIALIVGFHFFAFGATRVWPRAIIAPATVIVIFGTAGLILSATPQLGWARLVSGELTASSSSAAPCT